MSTPITVILTPAQVAERWQVNERTVRRMCASGRLPGLRLSGKLLRLRLSDVEEFENQRGRSSALAEASPSSGQDQTGSEILTRARLRALRRQFTLETRPKGTTVDAIWSARS